MQLYNTITGKVEKFSPIDGKSVRIYSCGPTVYDFAHIGNFRTYIVNDLLRRTLKFLGYRVIQVMNITDVDDKTINRSNKKGISLKEYTMRYEEEFFKDIISLHIERPEYTPRATDHIDDMIEMIDILLRKGIAYKREDGIYFSINKFSNYGKLSRLDKREIKMGVRVSSDEYDKADVRDFALWKMKREGEPYWEASFGDGRPGWHIECSAMSHKYLQNPFDIHTGGVDLIFPHHENEIAQTEATYNIEMVKFWFHIEHLVVDGKKMSKSSGNFYTLRDILSKGYDTREIRYLLIGAHYRKKLNFTFQGLKSAQNSLKRIDSFLTRLRTEARKEKKVRDIIRQKTGNLLIDFRISMEDDINISLALSKLFTFINDINNIIDKEGIFTNEAEIIMSAFLKLDEVLGIIFWDNKNTNIEITNEEVERLIRERGIARENKDYQKADKIRDYLKEHNILLEDTPQGTRWKYTK